MTKVTARAANKIYSNINTAKDCYKFEAIWSELKVKPYIKKGVTFFNHLKYEFYVLPFCLENVLQRNDELPLISPNHPSLGFSIDDRPLKAVLREIFHVLADIRYGNNLFQEVEIIVFS